MPSITFLKGTGGLPLVPGPFSSPSNGAISAHTSSGMRLMVLSFLVVFFIISEPKGTKRGYGDHNQRELANNSFLG